MNRHLAAILAFFAVLAFVIMPDAFAANATNSIISNTTFTVQGLPSGTSWSISIAPYTEANLTTFPGVTKNSTSNIIIFSNLPQPELPSDVAFTFAPLSPELYGVIYIFNSLPTFLNYNGNTNIAFHTLFNFNTFYANLNASLRAAGINTTSGMIVNPLSQSGISSFYNSLSSNGITFGANKIADNLYISNASETFIYGSLRNASGSYFPASSSFVYATSSNHTLSFVTANIVKASPSACIYINLVSTPFCANATTPAIIDVPVLNGHYGVSGGTTYPLTISFKASLIGTQTAPFNYSVKDVTNGTYLVPITTLTTNSLSVTQSYNIPVTQSIEITVGSGGDSNYTKQYIDPIIVPTNTVEYMPITLTNNFNGALVSNAPFPLGATFTGLTTPSNVLGFNALKYAQYETCNLNNMEFGFGNGTLVNSWIEGNLLNELTANGLCSSNSNANALVNSANVIIWLSYHWPSSFLPANTGTPTTNTLYAFWMGNTLTSANDVLTTGGGAGEAPQLSCAVPTNTINCNYGEYDNGPTVFGANGETYQNFAGTSLPSGWLTQNTGSSTYSVGNQLIINGGSGYMNVYNSVQLPPNGLDLLLLGGNTNKEYDLAYIFGVPSSSGSNDGGLYSAMKDRYFTPSGSTLCAGIEDAGGSGTNLGSWSCPGAAQAIVTAVWPSSGNFIYTYNLSISDTYTVSSPLTWAPANIDIETKCNCNGMVDWVRNRVLPNSYDIFPQSSFGTPVPASSCSASITSPSNSIVDVGQYETFTGSESNCVSPYTYNILVVNSMTPSVIAHNSLVTGDSSTSNTFTFQTVSADTSNSPEEANVIVTDASPTTVNSIYSSTFTINPALVAGAPTASNSVIDNGQSSTITAHPSGGTTAYSYQWYTVAGSTAPACTSANSISGATSSTYSASPTTTNSYAYKVTDSASTPVSVCSSGDTVTVNPALSPTISVSPSSGAIDIGQSIVWTGNAGGGTSSFTYNFLITNSITHALLTNALYTGVSSSSNTFTWTPGSAYAGNTVQGNVIITDSATTPVTANSVYSSVVRINAALSSPTISVSNTLLDYGQYVTVTATAGGGTPSYTYNFLVVNSVTDAVLANALYSGVSSTSNSATFQLPSTYAGNSIAVNVIVADSASTPVTKASAYTALGFNSLPSAGAITPSTPSIDNGQSITLASHPSGGTTPYSYTWYSNTLGSPACNSANVISGQTASTYAASPTSNTFYTYQVADSASTNSVACSAGNKVTVNSALAAPTLTPSPSLPSTQNAGNTITFTATWSGGTSTYSANYIIANTVTGTIIASQLYTGISGTSNSFAWTIPAADVGNTVQANVIITDSASTQESQNSIESGTLTIIAPPPSASVYFQNTTNTVTYNSIPMISNTYYPYELYANAVSGVTYNLNYTIQPVVVDNPASYNNVYNRVIYTQNTVLTGNVTAFDIEINAGQTLSTNGHWLLAFNAIINNGAIFTNSLGNGAQASLANGGSVPNSFGGSGGGAGAGGNPSGTCTAGGSNPGGNTIAPAGSGASYGNSGGAGSSPALPSSVTNANIITWAGNFLNFFAGAGGGSDYATPGGSGANPIYMQANYIKAGTINAFGMNGANGGSSASCSQPGGGAGGGGGGVIVIAYNSVYTIGTYNTLGGSGGGSSGGPAGGNGGSGNVLVYQWSTQPLATANAQATFTLYTGVNSYAYVPPANQLSELYAYQTKIIQAGGNVIADANIIVNMTDMNGQLTFNSPIIQYFPNAAYFPYGANAFTAKPASWYIKSDVAGNQHSNFTGAAYATEQWSQGAATFTPAIFLTYNQFTPAVTFQLNLTNNPKMQASVTQNPFKFYVQNTVPSGIYTAELLNVLLKDGQFFSSLASNTFWPKTTTQFTAGFNNYTFAESQVLATSGTFTANNFQVYAPLSNYQNPNVMISNSTFQSSYTGYFPAVNNYCAFNASASNLEQLPVYMVNANGSIYHVQLTQANGNPSANDFIVVQSGSPLTQMQSFYMQVPPAPIPLENLQLYRFVFYNSRCQQIYASAFTSWSDPIDLTMPGNSSAVNASIFNPYRNATASCKATPLAGNYESVTCNMTSLNGQRFNTTLVISTGSILARKTVCSVSNTLALSNTLSCTVGNTNSNIYSYAYRIQDGWFTPITGIFGTAAQAFGTWGVYMAILLMIVFITLFVSKNISITILMALGGITVLSVLDFTAFVPVELGFAYLAGGSLIYLVNRNK